MSIHTKLAFNIEEIFQIEQYAMNSVFLYTLSMYTLLLFLTTNKQIL